MNFLKKWAIHLFIFCLLFSSVIPVNQADESFIALDISRLPYQQEIIIPIDTSLDESKYQPIDIRVQFNSPCWAKNETVHSIRIGCDRGSDITEIDSQIYDLNHIDETHIDACSVVFLIPNDASGSESYYLLYDDKQTDPPSYINHLKIKDTHYFYEPISGQLMDFDYYQLIEDDYIIYGIVQKGELLGNGMSNTLIKLLPKSTEFKTKNAEQIASFYMSYSTDPIGTYTGSQWATEIEKTILVHGNLMVRMQIQGVSPDGNVRTDNIYTYYYSPLETKKINVNVNHKVLNTIEIKGTQEREGTYCSLSTIKARSGTIEDMNLGEILPNIHIFNEDETIRSYDIPTDPSAHPADWLLSASDDEDLGSKAWFCMNDPTKGIVHGLLFDKHIGFINGTNDGIQIKTSVHQHVKLPGLEADSGDLFAIRNAYEDGKHSTTLSDDIDVSFNVMYLASNTGGYELVDKESVLYQTLIKDRPIYRGNLTEKSFNTDEKDRYTLTVLIHNAPSAPLGSLLAAATGRNISYLTAELYKDNDLASSGSVQRLQLGDVNIELDGLTLFEKIQTIRGIFDLKNSTFFKSVRFPDLEEGTYMVKIYKENPLLGSERKYIGYTICEVTDNTRVHLTCKQQISMEVILENQYLDGIKDAEIIIVQDDIIISEETTDESGFVHLVLPMQQKSVLSLQGIYQGFSIFKQDIDFGFLDRIRNQKKNITIDVYDLNIHIKDTLGLPPAIDTNPLVTSDDMVKPHTIQATETSIGMYEFHHLYTNRYQLKMSYKSFKIDDVINLNQDITKEIEFPAEFLVDVEILNNYGLIINEGSGFLQRQNKQVTFDIKNGKTSFIIPPGSYNLNIEIDDKTIATQQINIKGDKTLTIISNQDSMIHTTISVLILLGTIFGLIILMKMEKKQYAFHLLLFFIILLSLFQPWWMLYGETSNTTTQTTTLLLPAQIITLTTNADTIGGEISEVPEEFTTVLHIILYILIIASLISIMSIFVKKYRKLFLGFQFLFIVFLLLSLILFFVAMSEVTKIGIGNFLGSDTLTITIPGSVNQVDIPCSWGPSSGLFLILIGLAGSLFLLFQKRLYPLISRLFPFLK